MTSNEAEYRLLQVECLLGEKGELLFQGFLILQSDSCPVSSNGINLLNACVRIAFHFFDLTNQLSRDGNIEQTVRDGV